MNNQPLLSIIVPVYNEEQTVERTMERLSDACPDAEIIYVDDGSSDASHAILKKNARPHDTVLMKENGGKGSAVRLGLMRAQGAFTVIQDADLEYDPSDIPHMVKEALEQNLDALFGSRRLKHQERQYAALRYYLGGNLLSTLTNLLFGTKLTDVMTCYKLVRTDVLRSLPLRCNGFDLEVDIAANLAKRAIAIPEIGICYHPRSRVEGKKIGWRDFFRCVKQLMLVRFS